MDNGIRSVAEDYIKRGWQPVPLPYQKKAPVNDGWQTRTITLADVAQYFPGVLDQNIGVLLGKRSGGLVDIDLDCPEAVALAPYLLPPTAARFGRQSSRNSHWLYTSDLCDTETLAVIRNHDPIKRKDAKGKIVQPTIAELRTGGGNSGAQTVFPGSVHEGTGEKIEWEPHGNGTPAHVSGAELKTRFGELCAAALLARNYPGEGSRHDMALALGGVLARHGWSAQDIEDFVKPIAIAAGDREAQNRANAAVDAVESLKQKRAVKGWPSFADTFGERVADKFAEWSGIGPVPSAPAADQLARSKNGALISNLDNALIMIAADPDLQNLVREDLMAHQAMLQRQVPGRVGGGPVPRALDDDDVVAVQRILQRQGLNKLAKATVDDALSLCASEDAFHPIKDWLDTLGWDGVMRLATWLHVYLGADDTPYTREVGLRFLLSMVARIYKPPPCKVDYMLILEGAQGARKSTACQILADKWFSGTLPDITTNKEARQHLRGVWLVEMPELHAMRKAEVTQFKSFLTTAVDRFRRSYGRRDIDYPRQCVFIGTTNETGYLRDPTGNRRFWPIRCGNIQVDALARDRAQLFGEAVYRFGCGELWWPDEAIEETVIKPEQEARREVDAWEKPIADYLAQTTASKVTIAEIAEAIDPTHLPLARIGTLETRRITAALTREGWVSSRTEKGRFWVRKP